uniref:C2HC/C3H-type domain-containing protein n=1 Tax=Anopheles farauti TaxID=69004 RepID=A0A182QM42_9DIPT
MWNKLFKSKSKSSKNLSNRSCSTGSGLSAPGPGPSKPSGSTFVAQYEQYGSSCDDIPEPVRLRVRPDAHDPNALDLTSSTNHHRDSIGVQMCGIPMRRSKLSSAFKSLSLKRSGSKSRLKLATNAATVVAQSTPDTMPDASYGPWRKDMDDYAILTAGKRASLRPCKSDNNLNEKQQYTEAEKEEPVYIEECKSYEPFATVSDEPPPNLELLPCPICLRKFAPASLAKHTGICERVQTKKRKPFDSSRQRREGTELASYLPKNFGLPQKTVSSSNEAIPVRKLSLSKTPTFERKEFNSTAMSTSMPSASSTPKPALKRSMSQQNEPCPYCERCFGMKAYDRHVEWCREKALLNRNVNNNQTVSAAKERLQARIQYKAPQIRSKRAFTRDKYSGSLSCGGSTNSLAELDLHMPRHNSMSSSVSSDNGYSPDRYDPFLSARRQLEELFSPTTSLIHASSPGSTTSTSRLNQTSPNGGTANDKATNANKNSHHNSNFRRAYSLRMPRKVSRPMYVEKAKSNIQKGITDDGPVSPNFLKSSEYDELPIKSTFNALQMAEAKPKLRDSSTVRKNLKLDIKDPNNPAGSDIPLSKTDSLAVFLKYENELALSEKDMKDKSNSLSKRSSSLSAEVASQQKKHDLLNIVHPPVKKSETAPIDEEKMAQRSSVTPSEEDPTKKQAQKLVPIKLEPINITYNGGNANEATNTKPMVISLDAIIGKPVATSTKPKEPLLNKDNRAESSYIDPKLINKCDNLPINLVKSTTKDADNTGSGRASNTIGSLSAEPFLAKPVQPKSECRSAVSPTSPPPPPPRTSISKVPVVLDRTRSVTGSNYRKVSDGQSTSADSTSTSNNSSPAASHSSSPVDHRININSTNGDKRPQLTRQDREDSGYRTGQENGNPDEQDQPTVASVLSPKPKQENDYAPENPEVISTYNLGRLISPTTTTAVSNFGDLRSASSAASTAPATPASRGRSAIASALENFDVDEFMQSLEDLHRRSPSCAKDYKHSLFSRTNSSVSSRSAISNESVQTNSKRSNSLDSSHGNAVVSSAHYKRTNESSGVPRVDVCVRNGSGTASNFNSSNSSSSFSSPSHYSSSFNSNSYYKSNPINNSNSHNRSTATSIGSGTAKGNPSDGVVHPLGEQLNYARNSPAPARRRTSEESAGISLPAVQPSPGAGDGVVSASTVRNLPNIHSTRPTADTLLNGNGNSVQHTPTRPYYSSSSPVNGRKNSYGNKSYQANHTSTSSSSTTPTASHLSGYMHDSRYPAESFDHLERDLLKSVQELDRMCGSTSSVCSIDSEELYSVDDYPLDKRSSERSQASADSAYRSSLSTQSPPDYAPPVPLRQARPGSRSSTISQNQSAQSAHAPDNPFNTLPLHTSLPPITSASFKAQHPQKDSPDGGPSLIMNPMSKFCHECGARFMISSAKFCMSCGVRRIMLE